ncbi:MAG TPA: flagellar assembly peptidoglycan hydrolase FlgJ [Burkholderiaceae bacterium]|nr:flagellar assembly peptidoglycan hydrolase FlgJ [Burkholderiaceae bacterium]
MAPPVGGLAGDARSLQALRSAAAGDPKAAAQEAAKQFEALFMQELMKSMRAAQVGVGLLDNEGSRMGTEMLDAQMATSFAGRRGGLSELIARQLERQMGLSTGRIPKPEIRPLQTTTEAERASRAPRIPERAAAAFLQRHEQAARSAERASGIPATFMLAQAGHESGWGQRELRHPDGTPTHNLFGIKAGAGWKGAVAEVVTTEYANGEPRRVVQRFRAYASHAESFADYAALMTHRRYQAVRDAGGDAQAFAASLQRAGYATDPRYADKLTGAIATAQRLRGGTARREIV